MRASLFLCVIVASAVDGLPTDTYTGKVVSCDR